MLTKKEIKNWLLENCVNEIGVLDLRGLDFSDFDGVVDISHMNVKIRLFQGCQKVGGDIFQYGNCAGGDIFQEEQTAGGCVIQDKIEMVDKEVRK